MDAGHWAASSTGSIASPAIRSHDHRTWANFIDDVRMFDATGAVNRV
jgi:hypothetical protein